MPEAAPPVVCMPAIAQLDDDVVVELDPLGQTWLRVVDDVVAIDPTRTLAVGRHGDFYAEGVFLVAFDDRGSVEWSSLRSSDEVEPWLVRLEPMADGVWVIGASGGLGVAVWRYDFDGVESVAATISALRLEQWTPTPSGGLLLAGRADWAIDAEPVFVELTAEGDEAWRGGDDVAAFDRAWADGVVRRLDARGQMWQHDPRPVPFAGFPIDVGAHWARLSDSGEVAAVTTVTADGGNTTGVLRIDASGSPMWSRLRPRVVVSTVHPRDDGSIELRGELRECYPQKWLALIDDAGNAVFEAGASAYPYGVFGLDGSDRPISIAATGDTLEWRTHQQVRR